MDFRSCCLGQQPGNGAQHTVIPAPPVRRSGGNVCDAPRSRPGSPLRLSFLVMFRRCLFLTACYDLQMDEVECDCRCVPGVFPSVQWSLAFSKPQRMLRGAPGRAAWPAASFWLQSLGSRAPWGPWLPLPWQGCWVSAAGVLMDPSILAGLDLGPVQVRAVWTEPYLNQASWRWSRWPPSRSRSGRPCRAPSPVLGSAGARWEATGPHPGRRRRGHGLPR